MRSRASPDLGRFERGAGPQARVQELSRSAPTSSDGAEYSRQQHGHRIVGDRFVAATEGVSSTPAIGAEAGRPAPRSTDRNGPARRHPENPPGHRLGDRVDGHTDIRRSASNRTHMDLSRPRAIPRLVQY